MRTETAQVHTNGLLQAVPLLALVRAVVCPQRKPMPLEIHAPGDPCLWRSMPVKMHALEDPCPIQEFNNTQDLGPEGPCPRDPCAEDL